MLRQRSSLAHGRMLLTKVGDASSWLLSVLHAEVAGCLAELRMRPHAVLRSVIIDHLIKLTLRWHLLEGNHLRRVVPLLLVLLLLGSLLLHQSR